MDPNEWFGKDRLQDLAVGFNFPNLPNISDEDGLFKLSESKAVEQYIIKRAGDDFERSLLGDNYQEFATIQMLVGVLNDVYTAIMGLVFSKNFEAEKEVKWNTVFNVYLA